MITRSRLRSCGPRLSAAATSRTLTCAECEPPQHAQRHVLGRQIAAERRDHEAKSGVKVGELRCSGTADRAQSDERRVRRGEVRISGYRLVELCDVHQTQAWARLLRRPGSVSPAGRIDELELRLTGCQDAAVAITTACLSRSFQDMPKGPVPGLERNR